MMCRLLSVSRSGFYAWLRREPSLQAKRRAQMCLVVQELYHRFKRRYGAPRIALELQAHGVPCSVNYVAKVLRALQLRALNGKGFRYPSSEHPNARAQANALNRQFDSDGPNRKWVSDITYIRVGRRWAYLAVVLDLFSRKVVGWSLDTHMRETLIVEALNSAIGRRTIKPGLLLHSDRGVQYRGKEYQELLHEQGITQSMSRKGNCWDNAVMESFFARLKVELVYPEPRRCIESLRSALFEYIEIFYNRQRRHSTLGYFSPEQYELKP